MSRIVYDRNDIDEEWDNLQETLERLYENLDNLEMVLEDVEPSEDNDSCVHDVKLAFIKEIDLALQEKIDRLRLKYAVDIDFKPEDLKVITRHQTHKEFIDGILKRLNELEEQNEQN